MRIKVPATSANLGPGFDTLGMAFAFYNHFEAHASTMLSVQVSPSTCVDVAGLSLNPDENLLAQAYTAYFEYRSSPLIPAELVIEAHIPLSRGLGSSSSAIAGGLFLANQLHPDPLPTEALVPWAVRIEGHPDNVVPALLGGVRLCLADGRSVALAWPEVWGILLVIPPNPLDTHEARRLMPPHYETASVVQNLGGMGAWVHAIHTQNADGFCQALASDTLHEPFRGPLIPEFSQVKAVLKNQPVLGVVISGSGSAIAVFTPTLADLSQVQSYLQSQTSLAHCKIITVKPDTLGTQVVMA